jgi:hypothetical protein
MGCYVHAYVEIEFGGEWHCYSKLDIRQDYQLFERMAGVRGDKRFAIAPPRGLPRNPSKVVIFERDFMGSDGHSDSWLTGKEVAELEQWYSDLRNVKSWIRTFGYICGGEWDIAEYPEEYPDRLTGARLVFWFDN